MDYFGARYYGGALGRFITPDWAAKPATIPYAVLGDPQSLNLYGYVRNVPTTKVDADGHCFWDLCIGEGVATYALVTGAVALTAAALTTPAGQQATKAAYHMADSATSWAADKGLQGVHAVTHLFAKKNTPAPQSNPAPGTQTNAASPTAPAVPLPKELVGTQDAKSGLRGERYNSGPLAPSNGGVGDATKDFDTLTGGKSGPAPAGKEYPPGTLVGDNEIALRPATGTSGPRIDIPGNGAKPHETLHYPPPPPSKPQEKP